MKAKSPTKQKQSAMRADAFASCLTGLGTSRDKRTGTFATVNNLTWQDFENIYRGSDLGAVIAEKLPDEMLRKGFDVVIQDDSELSDEVNAALQDLEVSKHLREWLVWQRVYGGAAILPGADDGQRDLSKPLNPKTIKTLKYLTVLQRNETWVQSYYSDPLAPNYCMPDIYYLQPIFVGPNTPSNNLNIPVHESRLITGDGVPVTRRQRIANAGWGDSIYVRIIETLRDFESTWGSVAVLLTDWSQGIFNLAGLNEMLASGDQVALTTRFQQLDMARSVLRSIILDAGDKENPGETFKRETTSLAGVADLLDKYALKLAAAARMPVSLLFGQSPSGLNSTGDGDQDWFDDYVASQQEQLLKPALTKLLKMIFAAKDGPTGGVEPENWSIKFRPLKALSEQEESTRRLQIAQADQIYLSTGVVTPEEVAASRFGGPEYDGDHLTVDMEARDRLISIEDRLVPQPPQQESSDDKAEPGSDGK